VANIIQKRAIATLDVLLGVVPLMADGDRLGSQNRVFTTTDLNFGLLHCRSGKYAVDVINGVWSPEKEVFEFDG